MATARFLHAADLHLGSPLKSLGQRVPEAIHKSAIELVNTVFQNLVDTAIREQVDFVVIAGDIYDQADRDPAAQVRVTLGFNKLSKAGIKVFLVHGNHDPLTPDFLSGGMLPEGVVVFPAREVASYSVKMRNGAVVTVAGVSYETEKEESNLVPLFAQVKGDTIVGVLHTNVGGDNQHGNYAPCSVQDLENSPVNYWALGHIHDRQVHPTPKGFWAYPGNLQGRSTKPTECGPKGVLIVEVDEDGSLNTPKFVACDALRFQRLSVDLTTVDNYNSVIPMVVTALENAVSESDGQMLLVRLEFIGKSSIAVELNKNFEALSEGIMNAVEPILAGGAVTKIENSCRDSINLEQERSRETLLGYLLRELDSVEDPVVDGETLAAVENLLSNSMGSRE